MAVGKNTEKNVGIVLLAAGASVRLARPKQLLPYRGQTLLKYSIQTALDSRSALCNSPFIKRIDNSTREIR